MVEDIVPSLLKKIKSEFEGARLDSEVLKDLLSKLQHSKASYLDANKYAIEIGEILSKALGASLTNETLPDGKMYYNIAQRVLADVLGRNYELVSDYTEQVQKNLNSEAKIGLTAQVPELNQDRIDGLVNRLASEESFDDVKWLLDDPIVNFSQSIVDDSIRKNVEFHHKVGLSPKIVRRVVGHPCKWCKSLEGSYNYPEVPKDIYRRHGNCRCTVDYHPGNGKKQNVHTKRWAESQKSAKIEVLKGVGLPVQSGARNYFRDESNDDILPKDFIKAEKHAYLTYDKIKNSNQELEKRKIYSNIGKFKEMKDFTKEDVDIAFNHVFNDIHILKDGESLFHPEVNMAESWERLITGKDIQSHDLILLKHERLEHDYMYVRGNMDYDTAHAKTDETYNYGNALTRYLERKNNVKI
ncbi:gp35 [Streptococcus pneumoniae]|nr:gp35 [Streptococcus pneumoniae]VLY53091.1 gp35 [Streptococcus pneumoniae]